VRHDCEPGSPGDVPCIVDVLGDMVVAIGEAFEKAKITHFISYGTLLGSFSYNIFIEITKAPCATRK
jgi:hypothetical protein